MEEIVDGYLLASGIVLAAKVLVESNSRMETRQSGLAKVGSGEPLDIRVDLGGIRRFGHHFS